MTTTKKNVGAKAGAKKKATVKEPTRHLLVDGKTEANPAALLRAAKIFEIEGNERMSPTELLAAVRAHLAPTIAEANAIDPEDPPGLVSCPACLESGTEETDFCPFCGDEGEGDEDEEGALEAAAEEAPSEPEPEPTPAAKPKRKVKKETTEAAETESTPTEVKKPKRKVKAEESDGSVLAKAAKSLEEKIAQIKSYQNDIAANSYDLAVVIREIHEQELWKARGHQSFKDFIESDCDISRAMAYRLMELVKQYDRETFLKIGSTKLALVASIDDSATRDAALEAAAAGATTKELARQKEEAKGTKSKETPAKDEKPAKAPKKSNEITLVAKVNGKPVTHPWRSMKSARPIKAHKDDAYAEVQISDDVVLRIALKHDGDECVGLTTSFVRIES